MRVVAWRIVKRKLAATAFNGDGARLHGGRWNNPGVAIVYTAQSQALAALEMLVHLDSPELLEKYVLFEVGIDPAMITPVEPSQLPRNWRAHPSPAQVRAIGDAWAASRTSAVLRVPSGLVPGENNFLLNPRHKDFPKLHIGKPLPFRFDLRLTSKKQT
ncbi:MAG: RES domain-containing protein [Acidobacteria bacterium]|nr:RES domain-containing protein [Acidobacteriota bacterium]MBI3655657.1 RES domain-containing protein [Acidobacteriota bacterium]